MGFFFQIFSKSLRSTHLVVHPNNKWVLKMSFPMSTPITKHQVLVQTRIKLTSDMYYGRKSAPCGRGA